MDIKHVANLARIKLSEQEETRFQKELASILSYVNHLNKVDTKAVEPLYQTTGLINSMRDDIYRQDFAMDESLNDKLVGQAPYKENRFIKVKSVLRK